MKHNLIALAVAAAVIAPVANAAPKVYGKINVTTENIKDDTKEQGRWEVLSNASRFGVKGEDELTATISAVYGVEWEVSADGNSGTDMGQRNRFVGLKFQDIGTVKWGRYDSYTKLSQGEIDQFNDLSADMGKVMAGENRLNNVIGFESAKLMDAIQVNLMVLPGEQTTAKGTACNNCQNGLADGKSLSVIYNNEEMGLYAALAFDKDISSKFNAVSSGAVGGAAASANTDITRLVGSYDLKDTGLTVSALYQMAERSDVETINGVANVKPKETAVLVSAAYKLPVEGLKGKVQYAKNTTKFGDSMIKDVDVGQMSLGLDYKLSSKAKVFCYYTVLDYKNSNNPTVAASGKDDNWSVKNFGLGVEHKF
ncbi:MAG: porin [Moraxellaceae bacterium]|nr:porin [Moraxellaceae bacterium]